MKILSSLTLLTATAMISGAVVAPSQAAARSLSCGNNLAEYVGSYEGRDLPPTKAPGAAPQAGAFQAEIQQSGDISVTYKRGTAKPEVFTGPFTVGDPASTILNGKYDASVWPRKCRANGDVDSFQISWTVGSGHRRGRQFTAVVTRLDSATNSAETPYTAKVNQSAYQAVFDGTVTWAPGGKYRIYGTVLAFCTLKATNWNGSATAWLEYAATSESWKQSPEVGCLLGSYNPKKVDVSGVVRPGEELVLRLGSSRALAYRYSDITRLKPVLK